jgi:hypothetical protein
MLKYRGTTRVTCDGYPRKMDVSNVHAGSSIRVAEEHSAAKCSKCGVTYLMGVNSRNVVQYLRPIEDSHA